MFKISCVKPKPKPKPNVEMLKCSGVKISVCVLQFTC